MAARRESVWINTDSGKTAGFDALSDGAFRLWTRLPFLVDDHHRVPDLSVIADDGSLSLEDVVRRMDKLIKAGFVDALSDGALYMSALSRRFYSFSDPADGDREADA